MPLKKYGDYRPFLDRSMELAKQRAIVLFKRIGEECVSEAVENGNYHDVTFNLRSSIGYVIAENGSLIADGGFYQLGGFDGPTIGRAAALQKASESGGLVLVLVAGMKYSTLVADKGYNVLDSAELLAKKLLSELR